MSQQNPVQSGSQKKGSSILFVARFRTGKNVLQLHTEKMTEERSN